MTTRRRLYTIGYERRTQPEVVALLREAEVTVLLDVRERPVSRVPGLSKVALKAALEAAGVAYRHDRAWGNPTHLRKSSLPVGEILERYQEHVRAEVETLPALDRLLSKLEAEGERVCVLCYERDPATCHRTALLEEWAAFVDVDLQLIHLGTDEPRGPQGSLFPATASSGR